MVIPIPAKRHEPNVGADVPVIPAQAAYARPPCIEGETGSDCIEIGPRSGPGEVEVGADVASVFLHNRARSGAKLEASRWSSRDTVSKHVGPETRRGRTGELRAASGRAVSGASAWRLS